MGSVRYPLWACTRFWPRLGPVLVPDLDRQADGMKDSTSPQRRRKVKECFPVQPPALRAAPRPTFGGATPLAIARVCSLSISDVIFRTGHLGVQVWVDAGWGDGGGVI